MVTVITILSKKGKEVNEKPSICIVEETKKPFDNEDEAYIYMVTVFYNFESRLEEFKRSGYIKDYKFYSKTNEENDSIKSNYEIYFLEFVNCKDNETYIFSTTMY